MDSSSMFCSRASLFISEDGSEPVEKMNTTGVRQFASARISVGDAAVQSRNDGLRVRSISREVAAASYMTKWSSHRADRAWTAWLVRSNRQMNRRLGSLILRGDTCGS